jgi:hypothetical protein
MGEAVEPPQGPDELDKFVRHLVVPEADILRSLGNFLTPASCNQRDDEFVRGKGSKSGR